MEPCSAQVSVVRTGRRLCRVESALVQGRAVVAKASALFLRSGPRPPHGAVWAAPHHTSPPPRDLIPDGSEPRLYYSDGVGWAVPSARHQNAMRKQVWMLPFGIVEGESPTPFQHAASAADVASVVINWGDAGIEFINADVTLALSRLPVGLELGLAAVDRVEHDGIATGTVAVFDRAGMVGTAVVCALANAGATVDPRAR
jgi:Thioesterase-like superfamily